MKPKLKKCPFHKEDWGLFVDDFRYLQQKGLKWYAVCCVECLTIGPHKTTAKEAIKAWNKRTE